MRVATVMMAAKRFDFPVSNNARVSAERKLLITRKNIYKDHFRTQLNFCASTIAPTSASSFLASYTMPSLIV